MFNLFVFNSHTSPSFELDTCLSTIISASIVKLESEMPDKETYLPLSVAQELSNELLPNTSYISLFYSMILNIGMALAV